MKFSLFLLFNVFVCTLFAQSDFNSNKGNLTLKYFKIEREQTKGTYPTRLSNHFEYLKIFKKDQRFAPDEPSSFSSLEYTFYDIKLRSRLYLEVSAGIFRNHIKGDVILFDKTVHFGLGNSQVGVSTTWNLNYHLWKNESSNRPGFQLGYFFQTGVGPQFTRWQNDDFEVIPTDWGIKGKGFFINTGLQLQSPKFWNRWTLNGYLTYNFTFSNYADITFQSGGYQEGPYTNINFTLKNKNLIAALSLSFDLVKHK